MTAEQLALDGRTRTRPSEPVIPVPREPEPETKPEGMPTDVWRISGRRVAVHDIDDQERERG